MSLLHCVITPQDRLLDCLLLLLNQHTMHIYSTLVHVSALCSHLAGEQLILVAVTKSEDSYTAKSADLSYITAEFNAHTSHGNIPVSTTLSETCKTECIILGEKKAYKKVNFTPEPATKAQRGSRVEGLLTLLVFKYFSL